MPHTHLLCPSYLCSVYQDAWKGTEKNIHQNYPIAKVVPVSCLLQLWAILIAIHQIIIFGNMGSNLIEFLQVTAFCFGRYLLETFKG